MNTDYTKDINKKINDLVSSELSSNPEARKHAKISLEETDEMKKPTEYLKDGNDMSEILRLVKNKKLSANKIKAEIRKLLKNPEDLNDFLMSILTFGKKKEQKEMTGTGSSSGSYEPLFSGEEPKKVETKEATGSGSSGSYETPKMWAKSTSKKDWRGKAKTQIPGGKFVQVKKKCKKFPYCNQGDINALNIFENETVKKIVGKISTNYNLHEDFIREIISNEIGKRNNN